jgi:SWI/SNF-related matrix-associated actin-dependent regulator 1 of chromatin subfamily A
MTPPDLSGTAALPPVPSLPAAFSPRERQDDEISMALRELHSSLFASLAANAHTKTELHALASALAARSDASKQLTEVENALAKQYKAVRTKLNYVEPREESASAAKERAAAAAASAASAAAAAEMRKKKRELKESERAALQQRVEALEAAYAAKGGRRALSGYEPNAHELNGTPRDVLKTLPARRSYAQVLLSEEQLQQVRKLKNAPPPPVPLLYTSTLTPSAAGRTGAAHADFTAFPAPAAASSPTDASPAVPLVSTPLPAPLAQPHPSRGSTAVMTPHSPPQALYAFSSAAAANHAPANGLAQPAALGQSVAAPSYAAPATPQRGADRDALFGDWSAPSVGLLPTSSASLDFIS